MSLLGPVHQTMLAGNQIQTLILGLYYMLSPQLWFPSNRVSQGQVDGTLVLPFKTQALTLMLCKQEFNPSVEHYLGVCGSVPIVNCTVNSTQKRNKISGWYGAMPEIRL